MRQLPLILLAFPGLSYADEGFRPAPVTVGIGAGITVPTPSLTLNTASVRLKVIDKLMLEPVISYVTTSSDSKVEVGNQDSRSQSSSKATRIGVDGRWVLAASGSVDLDLLGGLGYSSGSSENDPDGPDNNTTTEYSGYDLMLGLGLEQFVGEHWSVSVDGTTTVYAMTTSHSKDQASETTIDTETTSGALPLDPAVRVMGHLYF